MDFALDAGLTALAFLGHFGICVWLFNRLHAVAWPRPLIKALEKGLLLIAAAIGLALIGRFVVSSGGLFSGADDRLPSLALRASVGYSLLCWCAAIAAVPYWLIPKLRRSMPAALVSNDTTVVDVEAQLGFRPVHGLQARLLSRVPGNELCQLAVQRKTLGLAGLPPGLDGLSIAHLSDLHMTGQLGREFYEVIVDQTNALKADLVVITGDILEKMKCLPWIVPTLGRLKARYGKYFVLGNHETRLADVEPLCSTLAEAGLIHLGGRCQRLKIGEAELVLAGTELPWFGAAPDMKVSAEFRILLSHTPDQLPWAKANGFHLMLAGHNHGGQIRLPYLGALIAPSMYGCRYAGGLYYEPPTLLHVSRGIAGIHPIRLNCPPELAHLILKSE